MILLPRVRHLTIGVNERFWIDRQCQHWVEKKLGLIPEDAAFQFIEVDVDKIVDKILKDVKFELNLK